LIAVLKGEKPSDQMTRYNELLKTYSAVVATALIAASSISPAVASPSDPAYKALADSRQELLHQYDRVWKEADDIKYEINQLRKDTKEFTQTESDLERELQYKNDDLHRIENTIHDLDKAMI
jgi:septal ring factor EnvC (AmiA/AmiB activator)